ncbi:cohesin domain-containing protein [Methanohalophilus levihalophilus]|uniref:cohesin domain-containing protein n=1 Tax=Methanohalophilus levihalophilus TaxID=1431282 RepID=UPI001AE937B1|nr:cohesin domain-containing protein [Methanohalophilus levihalophilus]
MSNDGNVIYFNGIEVATDEMIVGRINSDGSGLETYPAPFGSAMNIVTNGDGSIAYFNSLNAVHKIEDGSIDVVVEFDDEFYVWMLQTNDKGDYVYITIESIGNIWKINSDATHDVSVVDKDDVEVDDKNVSKILDFRVADDGIKTSFIPHGYREGVNVNGYWEGGDTHELTEVFYSEYGNSNQMTFDDEEDDGITKFLFDMSGNGAVVLYGVEEDTYIVKPGTKFVTKLGSFTGWGHLNYDGSIMFTSDDSDGVLVSTLDKQLFPLSLGDHLEEDVGSMDGTLINNDGDIVSFIVMADDYSSTSLYVGHFYSSADDVPAASPNALYSATIAYSGELPEPVLISEEVDALVFESRSKPAGSSVQIPITLYGNEEPVGNMDLALSYDPEVLECVELIKGGLTENSIFEYNIMDETIKASLIDMDGFSGDGSVCYVKFNVIGSAGDTSPLRIDNLAINSASDLSVIDMEATNGVFTVLSSDEGKGDAEGDGGEYSAYDALYALLMSVDKIDAHESMDINDDGIVSSIDARLILKLASEDKSVE